MEGSYTKISQGITLLLFLMLSIKPARKIDLKQSVDVYTVSNNNNNNNRDRFMFENFNLLRFLN